MYKGIDLNIQNLNKKLLNHLQTIKSLENKEYMMLRKFYELKKLNESGRFTREEIINYKSKMMTKEDVLNMINSKTSNIEIELIDKKTQKDWLIGRIFVSSLYWSQNPGRNLRFLIKIDGKIAGFISLGSDVIAMSARDDYIGWNKQNRIKQSKLRNTAIASTLVPTQPLGYLTTGGKLISLLIYSNDITSIWKDRYDDVLAGVTTTSLYGKNSQYNGMPKYWKTCGETQGSINIQPLQEMYDEIHSWLKHKMKQENNAFERKIKSIKLSDSNRKKIKDYYLKLTNPSKFKYSFKQYRKIYDEYKKYLKSIKQENLLVYLNWSKDYSESILRSGPKNNVITMYYRKSGFKELWKNETGLPMKSLSHGFNRGVYFSRMYDNTMEFLKNEINESELIPRSNLDFDVYDNQSILDYWKRKWAIKRVNKLLNNTDSNVNLKINEVLFFDGVFDILDKNISDWDKYLEFKNKYI